MNHHFFSVTTSYRLITKYFNCQSPTFRIPCSILEWQYKLVFDPTTLVFPPGKTQPSLPTQRKTHLRDVCGKHA